MSRPVDVVWLAHCWREDMRRRGWVLLHTASPGCTVADLRATGDALLAEKPGLNAVALRWDPPMGRPDLRNVAADATLCS